MAGGNTHHWYASVLDRSGQKYVNTACSNFPTCNGGVANTQCWRKGHIAKCKYPGCDKYGFQTHIGCTMHPHTEGHNLKALARWFPEKAESIAKRLGLIKELETATVKDGGKSRVNSHASLFNVPHGGFNAVFKSVMTKTVGVTKKNPKSKKK